MSLSKISLSTHSIGSIINFLFICFAIEVSLATSIYAKYLLKNNCRITCVLFKLLFTTYTQSLKFKVPRLFSLTSSKIY